jgi:hypothetical protein
MLVFLVATTFVSHVYGCLSSESPPAARLREAASSYGNGGWNQKAQPKKIARAGEVLSAGAIPSEVLRIATGSNEADGSSSFLGFQDKSDLGPLDSYGTQQALGRETLPRIPSNERRRCQRAISEAVAALGKNYR